MKPWFDGDPATTLFVRVDEPLDWTAGHRLILIHPLPRLADVQRSATGSAEEDPRKPRGGSGFDLPDPVCGMAHYRPRSFRFAGDALGVSTPVGGDLLIEVAATPNPFTPNGDGINDKLTLSYKLREVTAARAGVAGHLRSGRPVGEAVVHPVPERRHAQQWNGTDESGQVVPPGAYLYKLTLDADREAQKPGVISVAY